MFFYAVKSAVFLSALYIPYMLLLRKESFFRFNRLMLLLIMLLSLLLPLCDVHELAWEGKVEAQNPVPPHPQTPLPFGHLPLYGEEPSGWSPSHRGEVRRGLWVAEKVYLIGLLLIFLLKSVQFGLLYRKIHHGVLWTDEQDGATVYCHLTDVVPFSWFRSIVISEADYTCHATEILRHEQGHIHQLHSYDILLLNLVQTLQWMNPLVWLLGTSLRDVHEYEADAYVLQSGVNARQYQSLLIKKAVGSSSYAFANSFNHSLLKNRITMMLQKRSNPWMRSKALYAIPVATLALSAFATPSPTTLSVAPEGNAVENRGKATTNSAEKQTLVKKKSAAAPQKTATAFSAVKEGTLITGTVTDEKGVPVAQAKVVERNKAKQNVGMVVTDIDGKFSFKAHGTGHTMSVSAQGYKRDVAYNLNKTTYTVRMGHFGQPAASASAKTAAKTTSAPAPQDRLSAPAAQPDEEIFMVVEQNPTFPGGSEAMWKFFMQNLKYPQLATEMGVTGRVVVQFVVRKDGRLTDLKALHGAADIAKDRIRERESDSSKPLTDAEKETIQKAAGALEQEAYRVIKAMPNWTPGKQRGKAVNCYFTIPVSFRLN